MYKYYILLLGLLVAVETIGGAKQAFAFTLSEEERVFVKMINDYRVANGLVPLSISKKISEASDWMAQDMAEHEESVNHEHKDSQGGYPSDRCARFNYGEGCGENLAAGYTSGEAVFNAWRDSDGHNKNMLNPDYRVMGISQVVNMDGKYNWYWINDFGLTAEEGDTVSVNSMAEIIRVTVTVEKKNNKPADSATVLIKDKKGNNLASATCSSNGVAVIEMVSPQKELDVRIQARYDGKSKTSSLKKLEPKKNREVVLKLNKK